MSPRFLISCGEPSGDLYAGALMRELRSLDPSVSVSGLGGPQLEAAGGRLVDDYRGLAVTGLTEAIAKLPRSWAAMRRLVAAAQQERPDVLVLIDFPDFNFRLASRVKALGVPVVYYISPQLWAWRPGRMKTMKRIADRVLVIFPFEETIYRDAGVPVEFVGHPLIDLARPSATREAFLASRGLSSSAPTVAILPGSRPNEVARILPDLLAAAGIIRAAIPGVQFIVARAPHLDDALFKVLKRTVPVGTKPVPSGTDLSRGTDLPGWTDPVVVEGDTDTVLASADVALTASGTATVQAALHGTPMVIVYRMSPTTYRLARHLVKVDAIGMVNLIAGEKIVPELVQDEFTPDAVAREAIAMLTDAARSAKVREGLARMREKLGGPGASRRAAEAILRLAEMRKP